MPVVKSNAYGHGLHEVFEILRAANLQILAVNYLNEAKELRHIGYTGRILIVGPVAQPLYLDALNQQAEFFIGDQFSLDFWLH